MPCMIGKALMHFFNELRPEKGDNTMKSIIVIAIFAYLTSFAGNAVAFTKQEAKEAAESYPYHSSSRKARKIRETYEQEVRWQCIIGAPWSSEGVIQLGLNQELYGRLREGDIIKSIEGVDFHYDESAVQPYQSWIHSVDMKKGDTFTITVERDGQALSQQIVCPMTRKNQTEFYVEFTKALEKFRGDKFLKFSADKSYYNCHLKYLRATAAEIEVARGRLKQAAYNDVVFELTSCLLRLRTHQLMVGYEESGWGEIRQYAEANRRFLDDNSGYMLAVKLEDDLKEFDAAVALQKREEALEPITPSGTVGELFSWHAMSSDFIRCTGPYETVPGCQRSIRISTAQDSPFVANRRLKKGPYESTAAFEERRASAGIDGDVTVWFVQLIDGSDYDADNSRLKFEWMRLILMEDINISQYEGQNAYGATYVVNQERGYRYKLRVRTPAAALSLAELSSSYGSYRDDGFEPGGYLPFPADMLIENDRDLYILQRFQVNIGSMVEDVFSVPPKTDFNFDIMINEYLYDAEVRELLIVKGSTREILFHTMR